MRFLVDAQLPRRLAKELARFGHDAIHTLDLETQNLTSDPEICAIADRDERVVVTKDGDFVDSFLISKTPRLLLLISTGNIGNDALMELLARSIGELETAFSSDAFVEMNEAGVVIRQ